MAEPVISLGDMTATAIPPGTGWTTLAIAHPADGRTSWYGQFAVTMPKKLTSRSTKVEIQQVRLKPDGTEDPTGQDDRPMCLDIDLATGKVLRVIQRQNWTYHEAGRTYSDEPIRFEARINGTATIALEWVVKGVLERAEASR